jgi:hypothetical protein
MALSSIAPVASAVAVALAASGARADTPVESHPAPMDRQHTVAEAEGGIIALPTAPISLANRGGSTPIGSFGNGDATIELGAHILYRADRTWAIGAGAIFAPRPTSDPNYGGAEGLTRTHSRSYFSLRGEFQYFPFRSRWIEFWLGATAGTVVVGDRFTTNSAPNVPSLLGTNEVTVSTGGFAVGGQVGLNYLITDSLVAGLAARGDFWLLPPQTQQLDSCDAIGDCPTLHGGVVALELGLTVGYRIAL